MKSFQVESATEPQQKNEDVETEEQLESVQKMKPSGETELTAQIEFAGDTEPEPETGEQEILPQAIEDTNDRECQLTDQNSNTVEEAMMKVGSIIEIIKKLVIKQKLQIKILLNERKQQLAAISNFEIRAQNKSTELIKLQTEINKLVSDHRRFQEILNISQGDIIVSEGVQQMPTEKVNQTGIDQTDIIHDSIPLFEIQEEEIRVSELTNKDEPELEAPQDFHENTSPSTIESKVTEDTPEITPVEDSPSEVVTEFEIVEDNLKNITVEDSQPLTVKEPEMIEDITQEITAEDQPSVIVAEPQILEDNTQEEADEDTPSAPKKESEVVEENVQKMFNQDASNTEIIAEVTEIGLLPSVKQSEAVEKVQDTTQSSLVAKDLDFKNESSEVEQAMKKAVTVIETMKQYVIKQDVEIKMLLNERNEMTKILDNLTMRADKKSMDFSEFTTEIAQLLSDHKQFDAIFTASHIKNEAILGLSSLADTTSKEEIIKTVSLQKDSTEELRTVESVPTLDETSTEIKQAPEDFPPEMELQVQENIIEAITKSSDDEELKPGEAALAVIDQTHQEVLIETEQAYDKSDSEAEPITADVGAETKPSSGELYLEVQSILKETIDEIEPSHEETTEESDAIQAEMFAEGEFASGGNLSDVEPKKTTAESEMIPMNVVIQTELTAEESVPEVESIPEEATEYVEVIDETQLITEEGPPEVESIPEEATEYVEVIDETQLITEVESIPEEATEYVEVIDETQLITEVESISEEATEYVEVIDETQLITEEGPPEVESIPEEATEYVEVIDETQLITEEGPPEVESIPEEATEYVEVIDETQLITEESAPEVESIPEEVTEYVEVIDETQLITEESAPEVESIPEEATEYVEVIDETQLITEESAPEVESIPEEATEYVKVIDETQLVTEESAPEVEITIIAIASADIELRLEATEESDTISVDVVEAQPTPTVETEPKSEIILEEVETKPEEAITEIEPTSAETSAETEATSDKALIKDEFSDELQKKELSSRELVGVSSNVRQTLMQAGLVVDSVRKLVIEQDLRIQKLLTENNKQLEELEALREQANKKFIDVADIEMTQTDHEPLSKIPTSGYVDAETSYATEKEEMLAEQVTDELVEEKQLVTEKSSIETSTPENVLETEPLSEDATALDKIKETVPVAEPVKLEVEDVPIIEGLTEGTDGTEYQEATDLVQPYEQKPTQIINEIGPEDVVAAVEIYDEEAIEVPDETESQETLAIVEIVETIDEAKSEETTTVLEGVTESIAEAETEIETAVERYDEGIVQGVDDIGTEVTALTESYDDVSIQIKDKSHPEGPEAVVEQSDDGALKDAIESYDTGPSQVTDERVQAVAEQYDEEEPVNITEEETHEEVPIITEPYDVEPIQVIDRSRPEEAEAVSEQYDEAVPEETVAEVESFEVADTEAEFKSSTPAVEGLDIDDEGIEVTAVIDSYVEEPIQGTYESGPEATEFEVHDKALVEGLDESMPEEVTPVVEPLKGEEIMPMEELYEERTIEETDEIRLEEPISVVEPLEDITAEDKAAVQSKDTIPIEKTSDDLLKPEGAMSIVEPYEIPPDETISVVEPLEDITAEDKAAVQSKDTIPIDKTSDDLLKPEGAMSIVEPYEIPPDETTTDIVPEEATADVEIETSPEEMPSRLECPPEEQIESEAVIVETISQPKPEKRYKESEELPSDIAGQLEELKERARIKVNIKQASEKVGQHLKQTLEKCGEFNINSMEIIELKNIVAELQQERRILTQQITEIAKSKSSRARHIRSWESKSSTDLQPDEDKEKPALQELESRSQEQMQKEKFISKIVYDQEIESQSEQEAFAEKSSSEDVLLLETPLPIEESRDELPAATEKTSADVFTSEQSTIAPPLREVLIVPNNVISSVISADNELVVQVIKPSEAVIDQSEEAENIKSLVDKNTASLKDLDSTSMPRDDLRPGHFEIQIDLEASDQSKDDFPDEQKQLPVTQTGELDSDIEMTTLIRRKHDIEKNVFLLEQHMRIKIKELQNLKIVLSLFELDQTQLDQLECQIPDYKRIQSISSVQRLQMDKMPKTLSKLNAAIAVMRKKCQEKDKIIAAVVQDLKARIKTDDLGGFFNYIESIDFGQQIPVCDFDYRKLTCYLRCGKIDSYCPY